MHVQPNLFDVKETGDVFGDEVILKEHLVKLLEAEFLEENNDEQ